MLQLIQGLPAHVVGIRATDEVTKEDVDNVLMPALDRQVNATDQIHYLLHLDTNIKNWNFGAWVSDAKAGLKHFTKWTKIAVVTDQENVRKFTDMFSALAPGEAKGFTEGQLEEAKAWVAA